MEACYDGRRFPYGDVRFAYGARLSAYGAHLFVYGFCHIELLKRKIFIGNCRKSTSWRTEGMLTCHVGLARADALRERYASGREQGKELLRIQGIRV